MKNLLVPTDFSSNSDNAILYSIDIALQLKAKLHIVYVYEDETETATLSLNLEFSNLPHQTVPGIFIHKMETLTNELSQYSGLQFECHVKHGKPNEVLSELVHSLDADMIVIGISEAKENQLLTEQSLIISQVKHKNIPVLTVPVSFRNKLEHGANFVLATDFKPINDWSVMDTFYQLALKLNATINIFYVKENFHQEKDMDNEEMKIFDELVTFFKGVHVSLHHSFKENVVHAIDEFAHFNHVTLVTMIAHERGWLAELFHNSKSKEMQMHGHVPLLTIPEGAEIDLNRSYIAKYW